MDGSDGPGPFRWPTDARGRQSLALFGAALAFLAVLVGMAATGSAIADGESPPWWLLVPMLAASVAAFATALLGAVLGFLALWRGERSLLLVAPLGAGLLAAFFLVGEAIGGH